MVTASGGIVPVMSLAAYTALSYEEMVGSHFIVMSGPVDDLYGAGLQGDTVYQGNDDHDHTFTIGYTSYTRWRDLLAEMAFGVDAGGVRERAQEWHEWPFFSLIAFSQESAIGPIMSAMIAADFAAHRHLAEQVPDEWFLEVYNDFAQAFAVGADAGVVIFQ
jgi:hypothetical protein